jgi:hypothetical protein
MEDWHDVEELIKDSFFFAFVGALAVAPYLFLGLIFSGGCGTSDITEVFSPDGKHKILVYSSDYGATTDFSLNVSLPGGSDAVLRYRAAQLRYHRYHQFPGLGRNFDVSWSGPDHITV